MDGIDALLCEINFDNQKLIYKELAFCNVRYDKFIEQKILKNIDELSSNVKEICELNYAIGYLNAKAVKEVSNRAKIKTESLDYVAMHGQTIFHIPTTYLQTGSTLQIGEPSIVSYECKTKVINNFRGADIAAEGQGAPLVPYVDKILFHNSKNNRIILNIGGISNFSIINDKQIIGYDVGPGNVLIDLITKKYFNLDYDDKGRLAEQGKINQEILNKILKENYFTMQWPKSTGRELFNQKFLDKYFVEESNPKNILRTITELTAQIIANEAFKFHDPKLINEIFVCGGGAYNDFLMKLIKEKTLEKFIIKKLEDINMNSKSKECLVFAILGYFAVNKIKVNYQSITGAKDNLVYGSITNVWGV